MPFLVILDALHLRKVNYQMLIANGSIIFALGYQLVEALLSQDIIQQWHNAGHCLLRLQHLLSIGMEKAPVVEPRLPSYLMQLVVPSAVRKAVSAATRTFTITSANVVFFIVLVFFLNF